MSVHPHEFLDLAKDLASSRQDEASWRCAASRAYYAALHSANMSFDDIPKAAGESSHGRIISMAQAYAKTRNEGWEKASVVAQQLSRMRTERNRADYELADDFYEDDCTAMVRRAGNVIELCAAVVAVKPATPSTPAPTPPPPASRPLLKRVR